MFAYFRGFLREKTPTYAVLECQGVGYLLHISLFTYERLPDAGAAMPPEVLLYALPIIREDSHQLYGFIDKAERELFALLISVSGVGANTARMILSSQEPARLVESITAGDAQGLSRIKGIGAKTASRIILDLKDKVGGLAGSAGISKSVHNTLRGEALSALFLLGFTRNAAEKALDKVIDDKGSDLRLEELIKAALKLL
jgi:Holliday junction DNA helicase RuvA